MRRATPQYNQSSDRLDPAKRLRGLMAPADFAHTKLMERLQALYVTSERDDRLAFEIKLMIENVVKKLDPSLPYGPGNRREGMAVAIIAESGAGKTSAMRNYLKGNPAFSGYGAPRSGCQLITVNAKAPCTLAQLGMSTLRAAGYSSRREFRENVVWPRAHFQIEEQMILFVHFEEMQRVMQQKNADERKKIVETMAGLLTDPTWPLHLIVAGLPAIKSLFEEHFPSFANDASFQRVHQTLRRRTRYVEFGSLDLKGDRKEIDRAFKHYEKVAKVSLAVTKQPEVARRLCHAANRQFGLFFELTVLAIDVCLRAGRKIVTKDDYADAYANRTLEPIDLNPFEAEHWESIDTSIIQSRPEEEEKDSGKKPARRRVEKQ
jgi:hypothetical protein